MNPKVIEAIAVTAELTGTTLSEAAARVFANDLGRYPLDQVLGALDRCRKELRGRLTLADVILRLEDGRPGAEEAWSMLPRDEASSVVWTKEMQAAWGVASSLMGDDDVAARMAFLEHYRKHVQLARDAGTPVEWQVSLGHDVQGREVVINEAVAKGRLTADHARILLPHHGEAAPAVLQHIKPKPVVTW